MLSSVSRPRESTARRPPTRSGPHVGPSPMHRFEPRPPVVIGIVGGIAAGKSTVAALFEEAGLVRVDADAEARRATAAPSILAALAARFGPEVLRPDGQLDRAALARIVFRDRAEKADLEAITHPVIRAAILDRIARSHAEGRSVLLDAPLLLEGPLAGRCDAIVFVEASTETRRARAIARGWTEEEWRSRERSQLDLALKRAAARATIANDGDLDDTRRQVADFLARWPIADP